MDDGAAMTMGTNLFSMNFIPQDSEIAMIINPPDKQDVRYTDVNEVDVDGTESMLLGMDYERRPRPNFSGMTKEEEEAMAISGIVKF